MPTWGIVSLYGACCLYLLECIRTNVLAHSSLLLGCHSSAAKIIGMDYTSNPSANINPDESNFLFLKDLYGTVPVRQRVRRNTLESSSTVTAPGSSRTIPDDIRQKVKEIVPRMENRADENAQKDGWRLLHKSSQGEAHSVCLGNGWVLELHKLATFDESE